MNIFNSRNAKSASGMQKEQMCHTTGCTRPGSSGFDRDGWPACAEHVSPIGVRRIVRQLLETPTQLPPPGTTFRGLQHPGSKQFNSSKKVATNYVSHDDLQYLQEAYDIHPHELQQIFNLVDDDWLLSGNASKYIHTRSLGIPHHEIVEMLTKNYSKVYHIIANKLDSYRQARVEGLNHEQAMKLLDVMPFGEHYTANYASALKAGATHDEIIDACKNQVNLRDYANARERGATHDEFMDAHRAGVGLKDSDYANAREAGATHDEIIDAYRNQLYLGEYASARRNNATHIEALDTHRAGINLTQYADARRNGATHAEALDAHRAGVGLWNYSYARNAGATHAEALDAHRAGIELKEYANARGNGQLSTPLPHHEVMDAFSSGVMSQIPTHEYARARSLGIPTHELLEVNQALQNVALVSGRLIKVNETRDVQYPDDHTDVLRSYITSRRAGLGHAQCMELLKSGILPDRYLDARYNATHDEAIDANRHGLNLYDYGLMREIVPHKQAIETASLNISPYGYKRALEYGLTHNEIVNISRAGVDLHDYSSAREAGLSHQEIMDTHKLGLPVEAYALALKHGATHDEFMDAHRAGIKQLGGYANLRQHATHDEAMDVHRAGVKQLWTYGIARERGATHDEALDAHRAGVDLSDYALARNAGATHDEAMDAYRAGVEPGEYASARRNGATHAETLDAHRAGVDLSLYAHIRGNGTSHEKSIQNSRKDSTAIHESMNIFNSHNAKVAVDKKVTKQLGHSDETNVDKKLEQTRQSSQNFIFNSSLGSVTNSIDVGFVFNSSLDSNLDCPRHCDQGVLYDECPHCDGQGCRLCNGTGEVFTMCSHEPIQEPF